MADFASILVDTAQVTLEYLRSPNKRLFIGYLCTSAILAWWVYRHTPRRTSYARYLFPKTIWLGRSAQTDYKLVVFNGLFKVALLAQFLGLGLDLAYRIDNWLTATYAPIQDPLGQTATLVLYTLVLALVGDLSVYWVHRLMHRIPALWAFHKIHHSATTLTPVTQLRIHPIELLINNMRHIVVFGVVTGIFRYVSGQQLALLTFLGVNAVTFAFFAFGANLRHSHVRLTFWTAVEHVFISPYQHQIHHSTLVEHHDKNFGSKFAVWDYIFGTLVTSKDVHRVKFGLDEKHEINTSLLSALITPFKQPTPASPRVEHQRDDDSK